MAPIRPRAVYSSSSAGVEPKPARRSRCATRARSVSNAIMTPTSPRILVTLSHLAAAGKLNVSRMDWFDAHAGGVQAIATLVLVALTGYYAWASRALVRETRATLLASARMSLQARLDRVSEMFIEHPELWRKLDETD